MLCIDCGAGTTGTANFLARNFDNAIALDINPVLGDCVSNVKKLTGSANRLPLSSNSVDLVISVQAFHHFDSKKHLESALRILRPGGVFAALCWGEIEIPSPVKTAYASIFEAIEHYWEPSRADTLAGYPSLSMPGQSLTLPTTYRSLDVTLDQFEGIVATWSGLQSAIRAGVEIPEPEDTALEHLDSVFELRWPLMGKLFRV